VKRLFRERHESRRLFDRAVNRLTHGYRRQPLGDRRRDGHARPRLRAVAHVVAAIADYHEAQLVRADLYTPPPAPAPSPATSSAGSRAWQPLRKVDRALRIALRAVAAGVFVRRSFA
jgi:hypothetical protein